MKTMDKEALIEIFKLENFDDILKIINSNINTLDNMSKDIVDSRINKNETFKSISSRYNYNSSKIWSEYYRAIYDIYYEYCKSKGTFKISQDKTLPSRAREYLYRHHIDSIEQLRDCILTDNIRCIGEGTLNKLYEYAGIKIPPKKKKIGVKPKNFKKETLIEYFGVEEYSEVINIFTNTNIKSILTPREFSVINKKFLENIPMSEIAEYYCVSKERIRSIIGTALRKIKEA